MQIIQPRITVCLASYNGEKFIKEQIESILIQLQKDDELIISDDGSVDNTIDVIKSIKDSRIKLLAGNSFRDPIKNFQNCLQYAAGEYIFLSDQDDVWIEKKCDKIVDLLKNYELVVTDSMIVDETLNILEPSFFKFFGSGKGILKNVVKSSYYGSCMAFRKSLLDKSLPFPNTKEIGHDLWIGLVAEMTGSVLFYDEPLILYRRHTLAFTVTGMSKSKRSILKKIKGRIIMFREITRFLIKYRWKKD
ncbi:glycosyltransferase involved in cell wall biosynthesis [Flavobacterium araucananum]|uniref:Alpha-L-Rha alpha-1,3-L-rhamnosyltransferase n=1 Tax=Flavobacterium araucananum TaxID=946678 RepID=A0A227PH85_9FLAO|nr:glycosyltransferase family 2 protein [Flavobacterium araucananum]OXG08764.1 alpha-L-Rha alpha-1,3-L-rhamnosyltransferase [Flavobacterium araucananum]PWJ97746.1 glycosyltransferase involved in cell wall biosynthesis [Flavobacterium araucananum]